MVIIAGTSQKKTIKRQRPTGNGVDLTCVKTRSSHCARRSARRPTANSDNPAIAMANNNAGEAIEMVDFAVAAPLAPVAPVPTVGTNRSFSEGDVRSLLSRTYTRLPPKQAAWHAVKKTYDFFRWDGILGVMERRERRNPEARRYIGIPINQARTLPFVWDCNPSEPGSGAYIDPNWKRQPFHPEFWQMLAHKEFLKKNPKFAAQEERHLAEDRKRRPNMYPPLRPRKNAGTIDPGPEPDTRKRTRLIKSMGRFAVYVPERWQPKPDKGKGKARTDQRVDCAQAVLNVQAEGYTLDHLEPTPRVVDFGSEIYAHRSGNASTTGVKSTPASVFEREDGEEGTGETTPAEGEVVEGNLGEGTSARFEVKAKKARFEVKGKGKAKEFYGPVLAMEA